MQTAVGRSGLLSLALVLMCSQGVWAGDRNVSSPVRPGGAAWAQGTLLQAAALSVAVGPGHQQTGRRGVRELPRRCRARLPSWYRRAQAAQEQGRSNLVAAVCPAGQPQSRARVRESGRALKPGGRSVRKPARQQRGGKAVVVARAEPVQGRASTRFDADARGARHRRLVQESLEQELEEEGRALRSVVDEAAMDLSAASEPVLFSSPNQSYQALVKGHDCPYNPTPCSCGWSIGPGCRCCSESPLLDSCDGCDRQGCSARRYLSDPIKTCHKMLPRLSDVLDVPDVSDSASSRCAVRKYFRMPINDSSCCGGFCDPDREANVSFIFEFQEIMAKDRLKGSYTADTCVDHLERPLSSGEFDCVKENMQEQWPTWFIESVEQAENWEKLKYSGCQWCLPLNECHYPNEQRQSLVPVQLSSSRERWMLVTSRPELGNSTEIRVLSLSRAGESPMREWPQTDPPQPLDHDSPLQEVRYLDDQVPVNMTGVQALMTSTGTLYHVYTGRPGNASQGQVLHWSARDDLESALSRSFNAFYHGSIVPGQKNCPACLGGIECPHATTRAPPGDASLRSGQARLPEPGQLLLVSEEEDGVNLWMRNNGSHKGTVERWSLEALSQGCEHPTRRFVLDVDGQSGPMALARHENWLYGLLGGTRQDGQLRRWSLTDAQEDPDWGERLSVLPRFTEPHLMPDSRTCRLYVMEAGTLPYEAYGCPVSLEPVIPDEIPSMGACRKWQKHPLVVVALPSIRCPAVVRDRSCLPPGRAVPDASDEAFAADNTGWIAGVAALVPAACVVLTVGGSVCRWHHKRHKGRGDPAPERVTMQELLRNEAALFAEPPATTGVTLSDFGSLSRRSEVAPPNAALDKDKKIFVSLRKVPLRGRGETLVMFSDDSESVGSYVPVPSESEALSAVGAAERVPADSEASGTHSPKLISAGD